MANKTKPNAQSVGDQKLNTETAKALAKMASEIIAIANGKTWTVTGRAFIGRDGKQYKAGDQAPKTNVNVFGWKLASDLFTVADAQAFAKRADLDNLYAVMSANKALVTYLNHETRHAVFSALLETPNADIAALVENARPAKVATTKTASDPLADLLAL